VLVTGATDGIGKVYATEFAKMGFNIYLVSRSEQKLQQVQKELQTLCPQIQIKFIAKDFTKAYQLSFYDEFYKIEEDVSVLVNNVGIADMME